LPVQTKKILLPVSILVIASAIAAVLVLTRAEPEKSHIEIQPLLVNATQVVKEQIQISVRAQGTITPRTTTAIISEVSGKIIEVSPSFKAGGFFNQGDLLLRIDDRNYRAEVKRAEAAVASARSNQATEQGIAEVAYQDWTKYRTKVTRSQTAEDLALRKPQLADAQAKLDYASADLDHARDQLERTEIRAPYEGIVRSKQADIGQYLNVGSQLAETFAIDTAELRMALPDSKLHYLNLPSVASSMKQDNFPRVDLYAEVGGELQQWQGRLVRTEGVFDERSRVLFAVAEIDDPYGIQTQQQQPLRIGTFVNARIEGRLIQDLVVLPRHILRADNKIWVIDEQNRLQNRQIQLLRTEGENMYVTSGLSEGELVCLSNISGAIAGTLVRTATITPTRKIEKPVVPEDVAPTESPLNIAPAPTAAPIEQELKIPAPGINQDQQA
jgi:RND family efflux transporter MFP subunit